MTNRYQDAIDISNGACNPSGIARSIVAACAEIRETGGGSNAIAADPAIRLMVYQLAYVVGYRESGLTTSDGTDFFDWRRACRAAIARVLED